MDADRNKWTGSGQRQGDRDSETWKHGDIDKGTKTGGQEKGDMDRRDRDRRIETEREGQGNKTRRAGRQGEQGQGNRDRGIGT